MAAVSRTKSEVSRTKSEGEMKASLTNSRYVLRMHALFSLCYDICQKRPCSFYRPEYLVSYTTVVVRVPSFEHGKIYTKAPVLTMKDE